MFASIIAVANKENQYILIFLSTFQLLMSALLIYLSPRKRK